MSSLFEVVGSFELVCRIDSQQRNGVVDGPKLDQ
jgi:hypothetical protein